MDPRTRRQLKRYGAPAAFLAAVTIAVLLVKSGLNSNDGDATFATPRVTARTTTEARTTTRLVLTTTPTTTAAAQYYDVESGDTLAAIAAKYGRTVEELLALNPGIDPTALRIGQRIRVG